MGTGLGRARATRVLNDLGLPAVGLVRADSVTNEVWMTAEHVVRLNRTVSPRLHREALLGQRLGPAVGYPPMIQHGGGAGDDWLVMERVPGRPLSRCWPSMSMAERRSAISDLAGRLRAVHATVSPALGDLSDIPQLLDPSATGAGAVARLLVAIDAAARLPGVDRGVTADAAALVRTSADALEPFDAATLVHGDLTFENVLWHDGEVTALLDFEYSRPGVPDLDLDILMRFVALPQLHVADDYEHLTNAADYVEVPWWLAEDYPELFAHPRQMDRMRIYSLAWDVRELLAFPPRTAARDLHPEHPYRRLVRVLSGTSYLDDLNRTAAVPTD